MTFFADFTSGQSNVSYTRMRQLLATSGGGLQEGVVGAGDLKVSQRGAGANMSVDLAVGDGWIQYDTGSRNGLSHVWSDAIANVVFNASDATNPRIDQVGIQLNDTSVGAGTGGNTPAPRYLPGTATAGATLDNRTGAVAAPNDWMRIADILVPAASTSVVTANIRDRRPWARGAYRRIIRTAANYTTASTTFALVDATNLQPRIECSGVPLRVSLTGTHSHSLASAFVAMFPAIDGSLMEGAGIAVSQFQTPTSAAGFGHLDTTWVTVPSAGSHLVGPMFAVITAGTYTVAATATSPLLFTVEELVKPNADNT